MARRRPGERVTAAGSSPPGEASRPARPVWVRVVVVLMLLALLLSVVAGFVTALQ